MAVQLLTGADRHDRIQNNGEKRRLKLKEVQDRLFELLCLIDEICRKEGVTYFLDGGTEIGCVREKDIIPWDDDADIKMKWSEYPAFRDAMRKHLPEGILVVEPEDFSPLFYDFFIRIVDTRYLRRKVTEADRAYRNMENYLCVDVSVHFHIPEQPLRQKIALGRIKLLYGLGLGHRYHLDYSQYKGVQKLAAAGMRAIGKLIPARTVCRRFFRLADHYDRTAADSPWAFSNWAPNNILQKASWFESRTEGSLRGHAFYIPAEYDDDLTTMYGDYMHPPKDRNAFIQHLDEEDRYQGP